MKTIQAWHFLKNDRKMKYDRSTEIVIPGKTYSHKGKLKLCSSGMHASIRAIDALSYAPGNIVCRVELSGKIIEGDDKLVATNRKVLWMVDAENLLQEFSRWCALQVIHLWDAPDVVKQYLEAGDESIRDAAWDAAWAAVWAAARDAARNAAKAAARAAARDAAWDAAWAAAWAAARDAARNAAWAAAWDAAKKETLNKFNTEFEKRLFEANHENSIKNT